MGLPGSGKTYLAERLVPLIGAAWFNADNIRKMVNDWDFSEEGRRRQSKRMGLMADIESKFGRYVVCDFICPTEENRKDFDPDIIIWMNTIEVGRYEDTNEIFVPPVKADYVITEWKEETPSILAKEILRNV